MLRNVSEFKIYHVKCAQYPPILDRSPEFAAKFLTKKDLAMSYRAVCRAFREIAEGKDDSAVLVDTIVNSKFNFLWFKDFLWHIEELLGKPHRDVPMDLCPAYEGESLEVQQPHRIIFTYKKNDKIIRVLRYLKTNVKTRDPINNYRMTYIASNYDMSDFQDDVFPAWYLLKNTTLFEQYNEKTNKRVRIDFRDGEFFYFLAGASDNWQMIKNVPSEMDSVVSALIFRNVID